MKCRLIIFLFVLICGHIRAHERDTVLTMFWNLENFFDHIDQGTGESDREFSSMGSRHWTRYKFQTKCDNIAKGILWMKDRYGRVPDVIGFAEVSCDLCHTHFSAHGYLAQESLVQQEEGSWLERL